MNPEAGPALEDLVPRLQRRDPDAFRVLYESLAGPLASFAYGMVRDRGAAEDMVQIAFLELAEAVTGLRGDAVSVRAWLYRCVRFRCLDEIRRRNRHPESLFDEMPDYESGHTADPVDDIMDPALATALESLTEQQRTVIILRHVAGLSGTETARVMGSNRAAIYAVAARAEASLRKSLATVESGGFAASESMTGGAEDTHQPSRGRQQQR